MLDWLKPIEILERLTPKLALPVALATTSLLVMPSEFAKFLHLQEIEEHCDPWLGIMCVTTWAFVVTGFLSWLVPQARAQFAKISLRHRRAHMLQRLSEPEKEFLTLFAVAKTRKLEAPQNHKVGRSLADKEILYIAYASDPLGDKHAYVLKDWVHEVLTENPGFLYTRVVSRPSGTRPSVANATNSRP